MAKKPDAEMTKEDQIKSDQKVLDQCQAEYDYGYRFIKPRWDTWVMRLKLYNNQKRDKTAVGDPLLFTIHQTVLASLYQDKMQVTFEGREEGDHDKGEALDNLALFDYDQMDKDMIDYEWDWDASFFGRGLLLMAEFDRESLTPVPEIIDPLTFIRDPRATSVNGTGPSKRGAARFFGREMRMTKAEMKAKGFNNLGKLKGGDVGQSEVDQNVEARRSAQGFDDMKAWENLKGDNTSYRVLQWFTHMGGKKVVVYLGANRSVVLKKTDLEDQDCWPVTDRPLYPMSHDWDGVSIPDVVEDKQRARSIAINYGLEMAKTSLRPRYLYDENKIKNKSSLAIDLNKFIAVDGRPGDAVAEVPTSSVKVDVQWLMQLLDVGAQKATATPDIQQGTTGQQSRTATELGLVSQNVDTRYGLSAKIFGWSERRFWGEWYKMYKRHFDEKIDRKVVRVNGALGPIWKPVTAKDIIMDGDPDIRVVSRSMSDAERQNELQGMTSFINIVAQDPTSNKRYMYRKLGELYSLKKDVIDFILPPTVDELDALDENEKLEKNELVQVDIADDDIQHLDIHNKANESPAKYAHIKAHRESMRLKKLKPELAPAPLAATSVPENQGVQNNKPSFIPSVRSAPAKKQTTQNAY